MFLSKSCEYAIKATVYVAYRSLENQKVGIAEIAEAIDSPVHFTGKILQELSRKRILGSVKGPNGGFFVEDSNKLYLIDVVNAIDGNALFSSCVLGLKTCSSEKPCPMHYQVKPIRDQLEREFKKKTVHELVDEFKQEKYVLK